MNRMQFFKSGLLPSGASIINSNDLLGQHIRENHHLDKLTDTTSAFILNPLLYNESFLEPYMDAETLHLHHLFHHGGAVKGANNDIKMIKKALEENNLDTVDF